MMPVSPPARLVPLTLLANGRPVCSTTGSPSISARISRVGPGPFFITATTPVLPTPVVTWKPSFFASAASLAEVFTSCMESSGLACRSRYSVSSEGMSFATASDKVSACAGVARAASAAVKRSVFMSSLGCC